MEKGWILTEGKEWNTDGELNCAAILKFNVLKKKCLGLKAQGREKELPNCMTNYELYN